MEARSIIYERFIKPFDGRETAKNIGVELEFPVVAANGGDVDACQLRAMMDYFTERGYKSVLWGTGGEKLFVEDCNGDCLSFDNSYNNFEFSLNYSDDLTALEQRFRLQLEKVRSFLSERGMDIVGSGTNPNRNNIKTHHVPFATYDMVSEYLHRYPAEHNTPDFPAFLSSVQTHLDVSLPDLPFAYTLFARLDFLRALLFANSPDWEGKGYRLYRDYLWEKSAFGHCPNITGKVDETFASTDDIVEYFLKKGMFNRIRDGKYQVFDPVNIKEYFENPRYGAVKEDIECYLSFKSVEVTSRGTLEVRGDCAQPLDAAFAPPAFNLGVLCAMKRAAKRTEEFFRDNAVTKTNSQLRDIVCDGSDLELIAPLGQLESFKNDMLELAAEALAARGKGEERLLTKVGAGK